MGRKNRNKIVDDNDKEKKKKEYEDDIQNEEENDKENDFNEKDQEETINIIWETRNKMIEYCDTSNIPLCDHLTFDILEKFINHMSQ